MVSDYAPLRFVPQRRVTRWLEQGHVPEHLLDLIGECIELVPDCRALLGENVHERAQVVVPESAAQVGKNRHGHDSQ